MPAAPSLRTVEGMDTHAFAIMMMTLPAVLAPIVVGLNAKRTNAQWRERREAKRAAASAK